MTLGSIAAIAASATIIGYATSSTGSIYQAGFLQIAPDNKIYVARYNENYIGVINNPDTLGINCNFVSNGINLGFNSSNAGLSRVPLGIVHYTNSFLSQNFCLGDNTFFNLSDSIHPVACSWDFGDPGSGINNTSSVFNPIHIFSVTGIYNITAILNYNCYSDTLHQTIIINPVTVGSFMCVDTICIGLPVLFSNNSQNAISYLWSFGDGVTDTSSSPAHQYSAPGTYTVMLITSNNCGNNTTLRTVTAIAQGNAQAAFSYSNQPCSYQVMFFDSSLNASGLIWNFGDGSIDSSNVNPIHIYTAPGSYNVVLIAKDTCGNDTVQTTINIYSILSPVSNFTFQTNPCDTFKIATFYNQSLYGTSYLWNFGDGNTDTIANPLHQYSAAGTYSVSFIVINNCGSDTILQTINIVSNNSGQAAFSFSHQPCSLQVSFTDSSLNATGLFWNFGDGTIDSLSVNPIHTYSASGFYIVTLIAKNTCGNDTTQITIDLTSSVNPISNFTFQTDSCDTNLIVIFFNQSSNALNYVWNFGDGSSDTSANPLHHYINAGAYTVTLISYNICDSDSLLINIQVDSIKNKIAMFDYKAAACNGEVVLQNQSINATDFSWTFGDGNTSSASDPIHTYSTPGNFIVTLTVDVNSPCPDSISKTVKIENTNPDTLFIPNCFTPNDDGLNDYFEITGYNDCKKYQLKIFNRWGQLIFKTDDLKNKWNGKFNNANVSEGVYFYILLSTELHKTGSITVLR